MDLYELLGSPKKLKILESCWYEFVSVNCVCYATYSNTNILRICLFQVIQLENLMTTPMDNFVNHEVDEIKVCPHVACSTPLYVLLLQERKKKYDKSAARYESAVSKSSQIKKNTTNALKDMEVSTISI